MKKSQYLSMSIPEWMFVVGMCCVLLCIAVTAHFTKQSIEDTTSPSITVYVTGEIEQSRYVTLPYGTSIVDALASICPLPTAALHQVCYDAPLTNGLVVVVPKQGVISVYISGAVVEEHVIHLPQGSRFPALIKQKELFSPDADLRFLHRKRRLLKDGEHIVIPSRQDLSTHNM